MSADLIIFWNDRLNILNTAVTLTASSTQSGYSINNVRYADLVLPWKGNDSTTTDEWLKSDGTTTGWLGTAADTAFSIIAYDNRNAHQDTVKLQYDTADNTSFSSPSTLATWTVGTPNNTEVTMEWKQFTIPTPAKRYYRIVEFGNERTEAAGTVTTKVFAWGMFNATDVLRLSVDYSKEGESPYDISTNFRYGTVATAGGVQIFNKVAQPAQTFSVVFRPGTDTFWATAIKNRLRSLEGPARAFFIQKEGINNLALSNFFLCRLVGLDFNSSRPYQDQYMFEMKFVTEPWI